MKRNSKELRRRARLKRILDSCEKVLEEVVKEAATGVATADSVTNVANLKNAQRTLPYLRRLWGV